MASFPTINKAPGVYIQEITLPGPIAGVCASAAAATACAARLASTTRHRPSNAVVRRRYLHMVTL